MKFKSGLECIEKAMEYTADAQAWKGIFWQDLKRKEEAIKCYTKSIELKTNTDVFLYQGNCLCHFKKYDEAFVCYNEAIRL